VYARGSQADVNGTTPRNAFRHPSEQGLSDTMLSGSALSVGREALQAAHDALSDLGACMRGLPKEIPANNDTLYALLEVLVEKIKFMRWVDCSFRSAYTAGEK
jgi:hypothetical protein